MCASQPIKQEITWLISHWNVADAFLIPNGKYKYYFYTETIHQKLQKQKLL